MSAHQLASHDQQVYGGSAPTRAQLVRTRIALRIQSPRGALDGSSPARPPSVGPNLQPRSLHAQVRLRPLFTAMIQHVLAACEQAVPAIRLEPPLSLVLDEVANIAPLSDFDHKASTAAGLDI